MNHESSGWQGRIEGRGAWSRVEGSSLGELLPNLAWPGCWRGELLDLVLEGGAPLPHVCTPPGSWGAPLAPYLSQSGSDI